MLLNNVRIGGAMTYPRPGTLIASLCGLALILATSETLAASGVAQSGAHAAHPAFRPSIARSFGHRRGNRGNNAGGFWWGDEDWDNGPTYGDTGAGVTPPTSGDVHYTYTRDIPWDAVHRFPPNVIPSARPYVPDCTAQTVTVPRHDDAQQTANINIIRCY